MKCSSRYWYWFFSIVFISNNLYSDPPDWSVNPPDFQFNASMTGVLIFNGEESTDSNDIIAAFVGDECRGLDNQGFYFEPGNHWIWGITLYSNENDETMTFKVYTSVTDTIYDIDYTYSFIANDNMGDGHEPVEWIVYNLSVEIEPLPGNFVLYPAYPNPFNPVLNIPITLDNPGEISVSVVDLNGHIVDTILRSFGEPGNYTLTWNGDQFPSGVYFISFNSKRGVAGQKVLLLK